MMRRKDDTPPADRSTLAVLLVLFLAAVLAAEASARNPEPASGARAGSLASDASESVVGRGRDATEGLGPDSTAALRRGRRLTSWLLGGGADSIVAVMDSAYLERIGGASRVASLAGRVDRRLGPEQEVVVEETFTDRSVDHYYRVSRFSELSGRTITIQWAWREDGTVVLAGVTPTPRPADTGNETYETKSELRLPFDGSWYVAWGGRAPRRNYHARARDQRFAYDFLRLVDGSSHEGDGADNADYHCFRTPVLAPAPVRVARAADSVPDNTPGEMNREAIFGNHVVLDHGTGEYSVLAHLRHGSVTVEAGDRVQRGEPLGECGNSGHSSEPHLHYHLQDRPVPGEGTGLPAQFRWYRADGQPVVRGEPVRGQIVRPAGAG